MVNLVWKTLKPLNIPLEYILRPSITSGIGISYHFFGEGYTIYGDGKGDNLGGSLQIDIFYRIDLGNTVKEIIKLLKEKGLRLAQNGIRDNDDVIGSVNYYHKIMIFNFVEEEVLG